jgi:hypothetical protein
LIFNTYGLTPTEDYIRDQIERLQTYLRVTYTVHVIIITSQKSMDSEILFLREKLDKVLVTD